MRLARKLSQATLAERAQMSVEAVSALERGFRRSPQAATIALLVSALELDAATATALQRCVEPRALKSRVAVRSNVPVSPHALFGRESDVIDLCGLIAPGRVVSIVGPGGIGKTRIALEVARRADAPATDAIFFADFSALGIEDSVLRTVAAAVGFASGSECDTRDIASAIGSRPLLLILDNCEHVVRSAGTLVTTLAAECPRLRIVCTSRQPLEIAVEVVYRLATLDETDAVALFEDRARLADARFAIDDRTRSMIATLCEKLDGLPLAIELVAARVVTLGLEDLLKRVDRPLRLIGRSAATVNARQQTLRATVDWSFALLSSIERDFFVGLSFFRGGWTLESAHAVAGRDDDDDFTSLELLESLIAKSFVVRDAKPGRDTRYHMLETIRAYGLELVSDFDRHDRLALRALRYYRDLSVSIGTIDDLTARERSLKALLDDVENIANAVDEAVRLSPLDGIVLLGASEFFPTVAGCNAKIYAWADALEPFLPSDDPKLCSAFWRRVVAAYAHVMPSLLHKRESALASALAYARESGDPSALVLSLNQNVLACLQTQSFDEAKAYIEEAIRAGTTSNHAARNFLKIRAEFELSRKNLPVAKELNRSLVHFSRSQGIDGAEYTALENLLEIAVLESDGRAARAVASEAEAMLETRDMSDGAVYAGLPNMLSLGGYERDAYRVAVRMLDFLDGPHYQKCSTYRVLALSFALVGSYEASATLEGFARKVTLDVDALAVPAGSAITQRHLADMLEQHLDRECRERAYAEGMRLDDNAARTLASGLRQTQIATLAEHRAIDAKYGGAS